MSIDPVPCRTLGQYVEELIARLGRWDPGAVARILELVGDRRARIGVDEEEIEIRFGPAGLFVEEGRTGVSVDGEGYTDRGTVLDLLDGYIEVTEAIRNGFLRVKGELTAVTRMFAAIEILLDGATRNPSLQRLGRDYREDPCLEPVKRLRPGNRLPRAGGQAEEREEGEEDQLKRLRLLP